MSELSVRVEQRWALLQRRGPYALLVLACLLAIVSGPAIGATARVPYVLACAAVLALAHWWCADRRWDQGRLDDGLGQAYVAARTVLAFVMAWLNPFCAVFAFVGYFDAPTYVRPRAVPYVLIGTAITMAGSQSGGFPPDGPAQTVGFAALLALNALLAFVFMALGKQETALTQERTATIAALEVANARLERALHDNAALHDELVARAREAGVHDERERLALEIHDTIAQGLAGIVAQLQAADETVDDDAARAHRARATELARTALAEARRSVQALGPSALERLDLVDAVRTRAHDWAGEHGAVADVVVTGDAEPLPPEIEAVVVRVVDEALANAARHAEASRVGVTLSYTDDEVVVDVRDDGLGFDVDAAASRPATEGGRRFGIRGMRRRAERVGGVLVVESEVGGGTAVSLRVPSVHDD